MPDLKIDLELLSRLQSRLAVISWEFSHTKEFSERVAGYVGHAGLEGVVRNFASGWNIHREAIEKKLTFVKDATEAIHDTFTELDRRLEEKAESLGKTPDTQHAASGAK